MSRKIPTHFLVVFKIFSQNDFFFTFENTLNGLISCKQVKERKDRIMEKLSIVAQAEVPREAKIVIGAEKIGEVVNKELSHNIGKKVLRLINSEKGKGIVTKTKFPTYDSEIHRIELTLVNERELRNLKNEKDRLEKENEKLEKENEKLEKENERLKEKIEAYEAIGVGQVIEAMTKAEVVTEFLTKLQNLSEEYAERINE